MAKFSLIFHRILNILLIIVFIIYWIFTLATNSPENPLVINNSEIISDFKILFGQKWSFFAPPNKSNTRLYLTFLNSNKDEIKTLEVLKPVLNGKRIKSPFNTKEEVIDYILNGSINNLYHIITAKRDELSIRHPDSTKIRLEEMAKDEVLKNKNNLKSINTLKNYAKIVLKNHFESSEKIEYVSILITELQMPKYKEHLNGSGPEVLMLEVEDIKL